MLLHLDIYKLLRSTEWMNDWRKIILCLVEIFLSSESNNSTRLWACRPACLACNSVLLICPHCVITCNISNSILLSILGKFIGIFLGSFILGTSLGILSALFLKIFQLREQPIIETAFFVIISYFTFPLAESIELTGIVAILFCGITQSHYTYINLSIESRGRTKEIFELLSFLSENFLFSYMGVSLFTFPYHQWKPGFIAFSFIGIAVGRILNIIPISLFLNIRRRRKIPWTFQAMLLFAGMC